MPEIKNIDAAGFEHFIEMEGLKLSPYRDTKGIWTIGIGMTYYPDSNRRVSGIDVPITKERAIYLFKRLVEQYETTVWSVTRDDINQNQFNALVSICYNIGIASFRSSTFLKRINGRADDMQVAAAIWMWTKDKELIKRRAKEILLYFGKPYGWVDAKKWTKAELWEEVKIRL